MSFFISTRRSLCVIGLALAYPLALAQSTGAPAGVNVPSATSAAQLSRSDRNFLNTAAEDGMAEVELGKLAQEMGTGAVKTFGAQMVTDHTKAGDELKALAGLKGMTLPTSPGKHQKSIDRLAKKSGADFDRDYAKEMVGAHKNAVALFEKASSSSDDDDVKAFARKTLPTLRQHLEHAQSLEASVKAAKQ